MALRMHFVFFLHQRCLKGTMHHWQERYHTCIVVNSGYSDHYSALCSEATKCRYLGHSDQ
ncbi:hypothetical protein HanRHA438_Chr02g0087681 [Helianthus annuus]|nr:hypothetical protein HanRHA438_Chr02g0087681 [Helianthus annuus]